MTHENNGSKKNTQQMSHDEVHSRIRETPIAIVGMASLMPDAKSLDQYWSNILEKVNSIVDVPASRWSIDDYYDPDPNAPDKTYCKRGAFLPEIDFNPMEFGLPPNILEVTDAGQLLSLVVAKDVLEDAGIFEDSTCDRDRIGCVLGIGGGQKLSSSLTARLQYPVLEKILRNSGVPENEIKVIVEKYKANFVPWEENSFPGLLGNVIAGRIANRFNLGGMNSVVDAACASSLSAIKVSISELLAGHSDMMITGGACADNSIFMYMSFSKTPAFTMDEYIKPFDEESKGMMVGEGIGMMAIKRLEDAEAAGDRIYSVIKGVGSSSDGKFKSIYAPRPQGQAKALRRAYADAGFAPSTVGLIEAHGTGTAAGDVAEFEGLNEVFSDGNDRKQHIALGSVKSQIGHLKAAAGAAGLMKCALALHHKVLPATLSVSKPNPKMKVEESPFYINADMRPWVASADGLPRRTGTSAFGFGGTNFHVVMEEYTPKQTGAYRLNPVAIPSLLSAPNLTQLKTTLSDALAGLSDEKELERYTTFLKANELREIPANHARIGFVSRNLDEAVEQLEHAIAGLEKNSGKDAWELPQGVYFRSSALECDGGVVALFSGQGSQYVGMGKEIAANFPTYLDSVESMDKHYINDEQPRLSDHIFPIPVFDKESEAANDKTLQQTQFAQPGIGTFSAGTYKILTEAGFKPDFVAGHSFGELTALWAAGVYDENDFYALAKARGQAMAAPDDADFDAGTMAAVIGDVANLSDHLNDFPDVAIANFNSKSQVVIAGPKEAIAKASAHIKENGFKAIALPVSAAFHTPLVGHAQAPFAEAIDAVKFKKPSIPVFSNSSGEAYPTAVKSIRKTLKEHILNSVRFTDELENIHAAGGRIFVEFGPKKVLAPMVANVLADKEHLAVSINPSPKKSSDVQLRLAATQLAVAGVALSNLDPFVAEKLVYNTTKPSPLNIKLSAQNYLSDGFKTKRDAVLNDGFKLSTATPQVIEKEVRVAQSNGAPSSVAPQGSGDGLEQGLALYYQHEQETLKIHEQYLETPKQYAEAFQGLMQQQMDVTQKNPGATMAEGVERSLQNFHENQSETLKIHEKFLDQQAETSRETLNLMKEHYSILTGAPVAAKTVAAPSAPKQKVVTAPTPVPTVSAPAPAPVVAKAPVSAPVVSTPTPAPVSNAVDLSKLTDAMLTVVADKTGYPTDMLELGMDMEADLGIDSIKRVEILGAVQEQFPGLPELNPEVMSGLRTLEEIVNYMKDQVATAAPVASASQNGHAAPPAASANAVDVGQLNNAMMTVVADKTGYPTDMLELSMDMEADLGIDSIKRVEILGAVQEEFPGLPELDPEVMSGLRTLGEIVDYMKAQVDANPVSASAPSTSAPAPVATGGIDPEAIQQTMMTVVADKTGYPTDMLELGMDMEADLGIDSIKRVEILGAVQEDFPGLPELDPEVMSGLRTLGEIVDYMKGKIDTTAPTAPAPSAPAPVATGGIDPEAIQQTMMTVVADKTGYPTDMLELGMDMEADLGIDSIKRVEILGAVQEDFPGLPELDPEVMSGLRTLGEIVDYMKGKITPAGAPVSTPTPAAATPSVVAVLDAEQVTKVMLAVVADKTGYPADMLELSMDMEADLGIDSIKRVEILGAVQEECPDLPEVNPEVLASMKTLEEIIECFLSSTASSAAAAPASLIAEVDSLDAAPKVSRSIAKLSAIPAPDELTEAVPEGRSCVITDDGTKLTSALSASLAKQGWNVAVLSFPKNVVAKRAKLGKAVTRIELADIEEATLTDALGEIETKLGTPARFIHLDSSDGKTDSRAVLQTVFLTAKHLRDALNNAPDNTRCAFVTVAHLDGQLGHGGGSFPVVPGGLFGLTKTVNLEWPDVFCRAIDLAPSIDADQAVEHILAECADPNRVIAEVGYSSEGRSTLVPYMDENADLDAITGNGKSAVDKNAVFLVSGGAKGVTAECTVKLATATQAKFILLGRSELTDIPDWAESIFGEPDLIKAGMEHLKSTGDKPTPMKVKSLIRPIESTRSIEDVLQRIEATGAQVAYISCDVSDAKTMKTKLDSITEDFGAVTGIIHGAGVLADKLIENKTLDDFNWVYSPKIDGMDAMLRCVDAAKLTHLSLFSSAAGFFGNPAQSDYSIANEILNKTALSFKGEHPNCHVTSFNWGPWDGGMVTPELKKLFAERNIDVIPIEEGTDLFVHDLSDTANAAPQILVGSSMEFDAGSVDSALHHYQITRNMSVSQNPFLEDHVIDGKPVLPMAGVMNWMASSCEALHPGYRFFSLDDMKMLKGIVFQNGNLEQFHLDIQEVEKSDGTIKLDVTMWSGTADARLNHYSGTVTLVSGDPEGLVYSGFNADEADAVDGAEFYENGTLFHGPMFQVIDRALNSSEGKLTLECTTQNLSAENQGQFPIASQDLYATDAKFQALLIWARQFKEAGALPTSFTRCEQYRTITPGERFYLSLEIESATNARVNGTITIHDAHGNVFSRIIGAETTISKSLTFAATTN